MKKIRTPVKAPLQTGQSKTTPSPNSVVYAHSPPTCTLADLSEADKQKVARLVDKLVALGHEHDKALETIEIQRKQHEEALRQLSSSLEGQLSIIEDQLKIKDEMILALQTKETMLTSMLALYQGKMRNMNEVVRMAAASDQHHLIKQKDLESRLEHFSSIVETQKKLIDSFDQERQAVEAKVQASTAQNEDIQRRLTEENRARNDLQVNLQQLEQRYQKAQNQINSLSLQLSLTQDKLREQNLPHQKHSSHQNFIPPSPIPIIPTPSSNSNDDDYSHYSLMFQSSDEASSQDSRPSTIVDYSPGRSAMSIQPAARVHHGLPRPPTFPSMPNLPVQTQHPFQHNKLQNVNHPIQHQQDQLEVSGLTEDSDDSAPQYYSHVSHQSQSVVGIAMDSSPDTHNSQQHFYSRPPSTTTGTAPSSSSIRRKSIQPEEEEMDDILDLLDKHDTDKKGSLNQKKNKHKVRFQKPLDDSDISSNISTTNSITSLSVGSIGITGKGKDNKIKSKKKTKDSKETKEVITTREVKDNKIQKINSTNLGTNYDASLFDLVAQLNF
jgi:hypothetical protein